MADAFAYDRKDNIFFIAAFAHHNFVSAEDAKKVFEATWQYWKKNIGIRCYAVIDYTETKIEKEALEIFAAERQRINAELGITSVRFSDDVATRAVVRAMSIKIHQASNLYGNREEAIAVVHGIADGRIALGA